MKKVLKNLMLVTVMSLLCMAVAVTAGAYSYEGTCGAEGDNLTWYIDTDTATLHIEGEGDMEDYNRFNYNGSEYAPWIDYEGSFSYVKIGEKVSSIGNCAFDFYYDNYKTVKIGKDVEKIGSNAFNSIDNIVIDDDNNYCYIDNDVLFSEGGTVIAYSNLRKNSYIVPEGVVSINEDALKGVYESVFIPSTLQSISRGSFTNDTPHIYIDENNPYLSSDEYGVVFNKDKTILLFAPKAEYSGLDNYYMIPDTVVEISDYAFSNESPYPRYFIPDSVTHIGSHAFDFYGGKIFIPSSVTSFGEHIIGDYFDDMTGGTNVYYEGSEEQWKQIRNLDSYNESVWGLEIIYEHSHILEEKTMGCKRVKQCSLCEVVCEIINVNHDWYEGGGSFDCIEGGSKVYYCWNCMESKAEALAPTGQHDWYREYTEDYYNCEEGGTVEYACYNCNAERYETVAPKEHDWYRDSEDSWYNCTEGGTLEYECRNCDADRYETVAPKAEHEYEIPADETLASFCGKEQVWVGCKNCDEEFLFWYIGTKEHDYNTKWTVLTRATCTYPGISVRACYHCADIESQTTPAYGHFDNDEDGKCDECKVIIEIYAPNDPSIPADPPVYPGEPDDTHTEHTYGEWTEKDGIMYRVCSGCGHVETEEIESTPDTPEDPSKDCSCNCHKSGIVGIIWKILRFFYMIFKMNPVCACGMAHY